MADQGCVWGVVATGVQDGFQAAGGAAKVIDGTNLGGMQDRLTHPE
jgi:hypothetical protein